MTSDTHPIDIGIPEADRIAIADGLSRVMADTYTLYLKTHSYHWNVTGPQFNTLHLMFETQYNELWVAVDLIAERIRSLGRPAPGTPSSRRSPGSRTPTACRPRRTCSPIWSSVTRPSPRRPARSSRSPTQPTTSRRPTC